MLVQLETSKSQNGGFHSEYPKLQRFLAVINLNAKSVDVSPIACLLAKVSIAFRLVSVHRTTNYLRRSAEQQSNRARKAPVRCRHDRS